MVPPKLSLESYIQATECAGGLSNLSKDDVSQIMFMHGYRVPYKPKKGELIELLRMIKLSVPGRSTVDGGRDVSPAAYLFAEEMKRDLALLNWEECEVQSIQSFNQPAAAPPPRKRSSSLPVFSPAETKKNRRRRLEKMKRLAASRITGSSTPMAIEALLSFSSSRGVIEIS